jgi:hypothetical protein
MGHRETESSVKNACFPLVLSLTSDVPLRSGDCRSPLPGWQCLRRSKVTLSNLVCSFDLSSYGSYAELSHSAGSWTQRRLFCEPPFSCISPATILSRDIHFLVYLPMSWPSARMCPCMALSSCALVTPFFRVRTVSRA